jgi:hypothetical protein
MKTVKIQKFKLTEILTKNRADHREIFLKAQEGYRAAVISLLDEQLKRARNGKDADIQRFISITQPEDHTEDYDRVISMLEMSVDDTIEVSAEEFRNYVQDKWQWSRSWAISNSGYTSHPKLAMAQE